MLIQQAEQDNNKALTEISDVKETPTREFEVRKLPKVCDFRCDLIKQENRLKSQILLHRQSPSVNYHLTLIQCNIFLTAPRSAGGLWWMVTIQSAGL